MNKPQFSNVKLQSVFLLAFVVMLMVAGCKKEEDTPPPRDTSGGYEYLLITDEDTTIYRIPEDAVFFAQQNYNRDAQILREYQVATNVGGQWTNNPWQLPFGVWKSETWSVRQQYLVSPYENDVSIDDSAQFYYQIGAESGQFGYGWIDTFDAVNFNPDSAYTTHLWASDPIQTVGFDGESASLDEYLAMWITE